ncbi:hypothetical protein BT69DRAFT_1347055 [Atractiella rhizophila]|nr:hypothetical protein BT69DRAFT_1347055 [Atractiella rhizophila]
MTEEQTAGLCHASQEPNSKALVHLMTPSDETNSIHLSILPSFLSRLPSSIHTVRISCVVYPSIFRGNLVKIVSKLFYLSLEPVENGVDKDGVIKLYITIGYERFKITCLEVEADTWQGYTWLSNASYGTFTFCCENAIFAPIASYSEHEDRFLLISEDESSLPPSLRTASIIQLSVPLTDVTLCSISRLPVELLSLIFSFSADASTISDVSKVWREVSAPYLGEPDSLVQKYELLKRYPGAGRLWNELRINKSIDVGMAKEVIVGSPGVTMVIMGAFWNEEEAKIVLNAVEGLKRVDDVTFGSGSRKWRIEEIDDFMWRMGNRIRWLTVHNVEDSPASASTGLHLSSRLEHLHLYSYPPLASLSLPHTLKRLSLVHMCPLPSSISNYPLPPLLEKLRVLLAPFSVNGKTSILPTPLDFSHLKHLTKLILDGGEETSKLVSRQFFSTLTNATAIRYMTLWYCVVDSFDFPDFIRWFFGYRQVRRMEKECMKLFVVLFFGEWSEVEIVIARSMLKEYREASKGSGVWESGSLVRIGAGRHGIRLRV